jgi:hypothetical protein
LCLRRFVVTMILDSSTVGQSCKRFQSDINTDPPLHRTAKDAALNR